MKANEFLRNEWLLLLMIILPFAIIPFVWNMLPEQIPMHWNYSGEIDRYEPRFPGIFYMPLLNAAMYLLFLVIPRIDPRRKNYSMFSGAYKIIRYLFASFMLYMFIIITAVSIGFELNIKMLVVNGILVLFLVFGNFMGNLRSNYFVGFRAPWTLEYPDIWTKTHRFAGKIWVYSSIIMLPMALILSDAVHTIVFWVYIAVISLCPYIYSLFLFFRLKKADGDNKELTINNRE